MDSQSKARTRKTIIRTMTLNPSFSSTSSFFLLLHQIIYGLTVIIVEDKFWTRPALRQTVEQSGPPRRRPLTIKAMARKKKERMRENEERKMADKLYGVLFFVIWKVSCSPTFHRERLGLLNSQHCESSSGPLQFCYCVSSAFLFRLSQVLLY